MNIERVVVRLLAGLAVAACGAVPGHAQSDVRERVKAIAAQAGMALPADAQTVAAPDAAGVPSSTSQSTVHELEDEPHASRSAVLGVATAGESYFQRLREIWARGAQPSEKDLTGWFAGRCYAVHDPNTPSGTLLVGVRKPIKTGNGPLFPPGSSFRVIVDGNPDPGYFDGPDLKMERIDDFVNWAFPYTAAATPEAGSMVTGGPNEGATWDFQRSMRIRKSGQYMVGASFLENSDAMFPEIKVGEPVFMCYYFKNVTPLDLK